MAKVRSLREKGKRAAFNVSQFRNRAQGESLLARIESLEEDVQECRQLNLRLAELTDVVQELLLPVAERDEERIAELVARYQRGL